MRGEEISNFKNRRVALKGIEARKKFCVCVILDFHVMSNVLGIIIISYFASCYTLNHVYVFLRSLVLNNLCVSLPSSSIFIHSQLQADFRREKK